METFKRIFFKFFMLLYKLGLFLTPVLAVASLFTNESTKFILCDVIATLAPFAFFVKAIDIHAWIDAKKHGVDLSKLSIFGVNPLISIFFLLDIPSYIWALFWEISRDNNFWEVFRDITPIIIVAILVYAIINKDE